MTDEIRVVDHDPQWARLFRELSHRATAVLGELALRVEHVGSTSVPGLAAKPVVDLDVVIPSRDDLAEAIRRLHTLGYEHLGDLGIVSREAFVVRRVRRATTSTCARRIRRSWHGTSGSGTTSAQIQPRPNATPH